MKKRKDFIRAKDKQLLHVMVRWNKDMEWLRLNHPESYSRIKENEVS
jgi:hypothetical protein